MNQRANRADGTRSGHCGYRAGISKPHHKDAKNTKADNPADLARLKNGETRELILSLQVDDGQITKVGVLHSTGDPKLDTAAAR
jgi:hypothetical protein